MLPALEAVNLVKRYPGAARDAVSGASLVLGKGDYCALLGENGAGKSSLVRMLAGLEAPDSGRIYARGAAIRASRDAARAGVSLMPQHAALGDDLSLAEHIRLATGRARPGRWLAEAAEALDLMPFMHMSAARLRANQAQKAAFLRALAPEPRILILDEPTEFLAPQEAEAGYSLIDGFLASGDRAAILVTHRVAEVAGRAKRFILIRQGIVIGEEGAAASPEVLGQALFGHCAICADESGAPPAEEGAARPRGAAAGTVALRVKGLSMGAVLRGFDIEVREGEVLGVTGIADEGPHALEDALSGMAAPDSGEVEVFSNRVPLGDPSAMRAAGMRYVPSDRMGRGSALSMSAAENAAALRAGQGGFRLGPARLESLAVPLIRAAGIGLRPFAPLREASGGEVQRLVLSRELDEAEGVVSSPRVYLFADPGRGLDMSARASMEAAVTRLARQGAAVMLISIDVDEAARLSDRLVVMREGRIAALFDRAELESREDARLAIGRAMLGIGGAP